VAAAGPGDLIVAHDVGTSGTKTVLTNASGRVLAKHMAAYPTHFPHPAQAEQEAGDWWGAIAAGTRAVLEGGGASVSSIAGVTFSSQMLGVVPMADDGTVLRRPIIWLDGRADEQAAAVMRRFGGPRLFGRIAGATLSGKDGIPKLRWIKEREPEVWRRMARFLDVCGYLVYRCTGRMAMDWTEASAYGLDLKKKTWLTAIMRYAGVDPAKLPDLVPPNQVVGGLTRDAAPALGLLEGTPVIAGMGDAPSAAVGAGAVGDGDGHVYLGTSGWIGVTTARHPTGRHGIAVIQSGDPALNLLIAEMETGGECVRWMADELFAEEERAAGQQGAFRLMDHEAAEVPPGSGGLLFTPWMYGERVPVTDTTVRSAFLNLGADHHRSNLVRAVFEGVAFNYRWILDRLRHDFHAPLPSLRVVGGGARSRVWMQILADVTQRPVETVRHPQDAGAVGAALAAGVALGQHRDFGSLRDLVRLEARYDPQVATASVYDFLFAEYQDAYRRLRGLYRTLNERRSAA
jgi:xylulokinase